MSGEATRIATMLDDAAARLMSALQLDRREARLEAQVLAAHALQKNRAWLIAHADDPPGATQSAAVDCLITRRAAGEPVAYLLGEKEFYGHAFLVGPEVLIPRPETELLVEAALERLANTPAPRILDLGTGSGCVAVSLALARPDAEIWAVDASTRALDTAHANAVRLGAPHVHFLRSDWYARLPAMKFDMIVSNPPYIASGDPHLRRGDLRFEPPPALASGVDGLDAIRTLVAGAPDHLVSGGWLILEHGHDQADACLTLLGSAGLRKGFTSCDLAGLARVSGGQWPGR